MQLTIGLYYELLFSNFYFLQSLQKGNSFSWKECAISVALSVGLISVPPTFGWSAHAYPLEPVIPDISVLISGPPIKDPGALLRYALPIDNKAIREVQKPLEDITDSLKVSGVRALDSVERVSHSFKIPGSKDLYFFKEVESSYMLSQVSSIYFMHMDPRIFFFNFSSNCRM